MAAGLGFKTFTTGEVLTAGDVNGYLMQGVLVFASAAARDSAITSPQEGQFAYLKDTNVTTYYTGSAWTNLDTTGMVNPMTTTGDTIYSSSGSTPARLGIGSTGQVLTVAGGVPSWATPAGSGANWTLLNSGGTALTGAQTITVSGISGKDKIMVLYASASSANNSTEFRCRLNTDTGNNYYDFGISWEIHAVYQTNWLGERNGAARSGIWLNQTGGSSSGSTFSGGIIITGCNSSGVKSFQAMAGCSNSVNNSATASTGYYDSSSTISSVSLHSTSGNFDNGTIYVYTTA